MIKYDYSIDRTNPNFAANKILSLIRPGARVLDVGCSTGYLSKILRNEFSCVVTGIELDREAAEKAVVVCDRVVVGNIEHLPLSLFDGSSFDIIIFADVLEHLRDPRTVLRKVASWLSDDGFVLISIPNFGYRGVLLNLATGRFYRTSHGILDDTHIQFFTIPEIFTLLSDAGFFPVALDRTIKGLADSEFKNIKIQPSVELEALINQGPETDTYQFIVKACPVNGGTLSSATRFTADLVLQHSEISKKYHCHQKFFMQVIAKKNRMIEERNASNNRKNRTIAALQEANGRKNEMIKERDQVIIRKNEMIKERDQVIMRKNEMIRIRDEAIAGKNTQIDRLTEELNRHWTSRLLNAVRKNTNQ